MPIAEGVAIGHTGYASNLEGVAIGHTGYAATRRDFEPKAAQNLRGALYIKMASNSLLRKEFPACVDMYGASHFIWKIST